MLINSSSSNIIWDMNYSNIVTSSSVNTNVTGVSANNVKFTYVINHCRECGHAQDVSGCYDVVGSSVMFVMCKCSEIVPEDNLEYLEYLLKKKEIL